MKKILKLTGIVFLTMLLCFALLAGCGSSSRNNENTSNIGLLSDGVLKVGMEIGYPPFEMFADDGVTPIGFDVDLAGAIANFLSVEVEIIDTAWDGIFSGLDIDKYDVVISAVTISGERMQSMDFSKPYIENWQSIVVRKGSEPITSVEELEGLLVGFQGATTSDEYLADMIATGVVNCQTASYDKVINCFDDLRLGRIDAAIVDSVVSEGYVEREPDMFEITWHQKNVDGDEAELFGVAIKKGNDALRNAINNALDALEADGTLPELRSIWLA